MRPISFFLLVSFLLFIPLIDAHLAAGNEHQVGEYIVDFGYSPKQPIAEESVTLSVLLFNATVSSSYPLPIDHLELKISDGNKILFSGPMENQIQYQFPHKGKFDITFTVEPQAAQQKLETTFDITIDRKPIPLIYLPIAMTLLAIIAYIISYIRSNRNSSNP